MNLQQLQMTDILKDLKENYNICSVKAEFASENSSLEEVLKLKEIACSAGLGVTVKIGGCEAVKDIYDAKSIGAASVVAPMIESPYALEKYICSLKNVFSDEERKDLKIYINIETITGFNNLNEILDSESANSLTGIIMGRTDFTGSLGLAASDAEDTLLLDYAKKLANEVCKHKKEFIIGGNISAKSIKFLYCIPNLSGFETRNIIFGASALKNPQLNDGIKKAIEFELLRIQNKSILSNEDLVRIDLLKSRL